MNSQAIKDVYIGMGSASASPEPLSRSTVERSPHQLAAARTNRTFSTHVRQRSPAARRREPIAGRRKPAEQIRRENQVPTSRYRPTWRRPLCARDSQRRFDRIQLANGDRHGYWTDGSAMLPHNLSRYCGMDRNEHAAGGMPQYVKRPIVSRRSKRRC